MTWSWDVYINTNVELYKINIKTIPCNDQLQQLIHSSSNKCHLGPTRDKVYSTSTALCNNHNSPRTTVGAKYGSKEYAYSIIFSMPVRATSGRTRSMVMLCSPPLISGYCINTLYYQVCFRVSVKWKWQIVDHVLTFRIEKREWIFTSTCRTKKVGGRFEWCSLATQRNQHCLLLKLVSCHEVKHNNYCKPANLRKRYCD